MDQHSLKKLAVILLISGVLFFVFKPKKDGRDKLWAFAGSGNNGSKAKSFIKKPELPDAQKHEPSLKLAYEALCAYIDAVNEGESQSNLASIRNEIEDQMGMVIYEDQNGLLAVKDTQNNDILVNS